ncbi:MAG: 50S ribosomal protein L32e [Candidatus Korarchaeota archaeon]|nr:50S ribosomal protein L32e [Candidatus Korarchaeota archaeon]NIU84440.1 50S ribosomal protein L32e [Candidatus Thorarchaeota archaeon]NIW12923.1 50S ribosomal protein L32e [Candidatus Thorarchaeota archaeon]NIW51887.1 50S ribosomal protein L32e [Candidatus Korarchaeota archaeon]
MNHEKDLSESETKRLLRIRKRTKRKFTRDQAWRFKRVKKSWRRPKGLHNKVKREVKGRRPKVKVGYRSPKAVRFLHPSGKREKRVRKLEDMFNVNPQKEVVRIEGTVGRRKRRTLVEFAQTYGIRVLNPRLVSPPEMALEPEEELLPEEETLFEEGEEELFKEEKKDLFQEEELQEEDIKPSEETKKKEKTDETQSEELMEEELFKVEDETSEGE